MVGMSCMMCRHMVNNVLPVKRIINLTSTLTHMMENYSKKNMGLEAVATSMHPWKYTMIVMMTTNKKKKRKKRKKKKRKKKKRRSEEHTSELQSLA